MRTNGQLCKCDRCGMTHFVKLLKTGDMDLVTGKNSKKQPDGEMLTECLFVLTATTNISIYSVNINHKKSRIFLLSVAEIAMNVRRKIA